MKNKLLFLMVLLLSIATDAQAKAWDTQKSCFLEDAGCLNKRNFYGQFFAGANFLQKTDLNSNKANYQTGYTLGGSLGYRLCYGISLEGEYTYRHNALEKITLFGQDSSHRGHFHSCSYMGNLLWNFPLFWDRAPRCIRSFIGAGIGYDFQQLHASNSRINFRQKWHHFSWQLMTGLTYEIFCDTKLVIKYKFHQGGCHFNNHSIEVGLSYNFSCFNL